MAATISSSPRGHSSPLEPANTFSSQFARSLVEEYAENELASDLTSKILFAFLDHLPLGDGLWNVCDDIMKARHDVNGLRELADYYVSNILVPIRASGGKTPSALATSRFAALSHVDTIASEITSQKRNQSTLKAHCLARDNNCCLVSGLYDVVMAEKLSDVEQQNVTTIETEAAHIIPFSLAVFTEREHQARAFTWSAIFKAFPSIRNFSTDDINDTRNVLTLWAPLHNAFGSFTFSLEPTGTPNRYFVKKYRRFPTVYGAHLPNDGYVTFTAHDGRYPLPDEKLLTVHAAVAAILHASGIAEVINRILQDRDETPCLAADGSTPIGTLLMAF